MRTFVILTALLLASYLLSSVSKEAFANDAEKQIILSISFDEGLKSKNSPVIYANGIVAGVLPGSVITPFPKSGTVIEIGLPQLKQTPIYSFVLGPQEIKSSYVDVVTSSFEVGNETTKDVKVSLKPNNRIHVKIEANGENSYTLVLPAKPYNTVGGFLEAVGFQPSSIQIENNGGTKIGVEHLVFDPQTNGAMHLTTIMPDALWSGAFKDLWEFLPKEKWSIASQPDGGEIFTDSGDGAQGLTPATLELKMTQKLFVIIRKEGYTEAIYRLSDKTHKGCDSISPGGAKHLSCTLTKVNSTNPPKKK